MSVKDFKVKNGLHVADSATIGSNLTVNVHTHVKGNMTIDGTTSITGGVTGKYQGFDSDFAAKATGDLTEHTNLFYTTSRADSAIDARVDSAYITLRTPEYIRETNTQTMTNKTIVDPIIDSTPLYGQQYGGLSVTVDQNLGDSTQSLLYFASQDSGKAAGLVLGVNNQIQHVIATKGDAADNKLVIGLDGTNSKINIIRNIGTGPIALDAPAVADDLITITNAGKISSTNTEEASTQTTGSFVTKGGIAAEKNIRGEDIIAANNIQANGQLLGTLSQASLGTRNTGDLPEGTNLYFTDARVNANFSTRTTDSLSEGNSKLYYTTARADSDAKRAFVVSDGGGDGSLAYSQDSGILRYVGPSPTEVRAHFSGSTGVSYDSATGGFSIGQPVSSADSVQFSGGLITGNLTISGDLTVGGGYFLDSQQDLRVRNALIKLADSNTADINDIGVVGRYSKDGGSTIRRAGFFRDASNGEWYTFNNLIQDGLDSAPADTTIDRAHASFELGTWNFGALRGRYLGFDSDFAAFSSNYVVHTNDFTATNAGRYAINTSGGSVTVTLPASPQTGFYVRLIDVASYATNSVIVNRNGSTIEGYSQNFELDLGQSIIEFIYINSNWQVYSSIGQRGPEGPKGDSADVADFSTRAETIAYSVALG